MIVDVAENKQETGRRAAAFGAERLRQALRDAGEATIIVATGASQFEMFDQLVTEPGIDWGRVTAFNDPPADFATTDPYLVVRLDEASRQQQFGEGWFARIEDVPSGAISMSIHQILAADTIVCTVPDERKAVAVAAAVEGPVTPLIPSSILQRHPECRLFLDEASASRLTPAARS